VQESGLGSGPGDGPLSVRVRPSCLKRDCDRRATSTGERCLVNVHAKSRLTPESLRALRSEDKGEAMACPDRTRAIPCTVRAISGPLTGVKPGLSRSLMDRPPRRSSPVEARIAQIPKLRVRVRFPSPAPHAEFPAQATYRP
jgi:hypothetical protein